MRLIDADKLPIRIAHEVDETGTCADFIVVDKFEIDNAPAVKYEPVVHAHWSDYGHRCSNCGSESLECNGWWYESNYCPYCGAKMDEEVDVE